MGVTPPTCYNFKVTEDRRFSPDEVAAAYRGIRERVVSLLRTLPDEAADKNVPGCPAWDVAQLSAHLVGVPEDVLSGSMDGAPGDDWTQRQVDRHQGQSLAQLADAYEATAEAFDAVMAAIPHPINSQVVMDAYTHEQDLREAVGRPGGSDDARDIALAFVLGPMTKNRPDLAADVLGAELDVNTLQRALSGRIGVGALTERGIDGEALADYFAGGPVRPPA